jgi:hypothetical protein
VQPGKLALSKLARTKCTCHAAEQEVEEKEEAVKKAETDNKAASNEAELVKRRVLKAEAQLCEARASVKAKQARLDCVTVCSLDSVLLGNQFAFKDFIRERASFIFIAILSLAITYLAAIYCRPTRQKGWTCI